MHFSFLTNKKIIIFIHIPKSSGTNLRKQFLKINSNNFFNKKILKSNKKENFEKMPIHYDFVNNLKESYDEIISNRDKYFIFSIVRNPWDRIVSFYKHALRDICSFTNYFYNFNYNSLEEIKKISINHFYETKKDLNLKEFLNFYENYYRYDNRDYLKISNKTQLSWLKRKDKGNLIPDKIYKFENLKELKKDLLEMFDIEIDLNQKANTTSHQHYSKYYDEELKNLIYERFKEDIEYFKYEFEEK